MRQQVGLETAPSHNGGTAELDQPLVLVVEDDPEVAGMYVALLGDEGYTVTVLESALGAVALVREARPRVIVLDLALPYRSGVQLLGDLKADPATAGVPVVVVSAVADQLPRQHRAAAAAVFGKPFDLPALIAALASAIATGPQKQN